MDEQTLHGLEYFTLLNHLARFARTSMGKEACLALRPVTDVSYIRKELTRVSEARALLDNGEDIPLDDFSNVDAVLRRAGVEGSILDGEELLKVFNLLQVSARVHSFAASHREKAPSLFALAESISPLGELRKTIDSAIDTYGAVKDNASPRLKGLRKELIRQKQNVQDGLKNLMSKPILRSVWQDTVVTFRNDRYVVPVKSGSRHEVPGIIHDVSQSKATCFIEPWEIVELNNELSILVSRERDEVERILQGLSDRVRNFLKEIRLNVETLVMLDVIFARASMSKFLKACEPEFSGRFVELRSAIHPLLAFRTGEKGEKPPVPLDVGFPEDVFTVIVSGANMGGKTVALKTMGLLSLMVQTGMHIPVAEGSKTRIFSSVYAVIGDEQDIFADLSTFSSQIRRIMEILENVSPSSLVLLDEICTNTDPTEGGALALAVLDQLAERGARTMATTHYNTLKMYGLMRDAAINASVEFDSATHSPTYRLTYGAPGYSNALEISRKLGMNETVLARAESYLSPQERKSLELVQDIEQAYHDIQKERREAVRLREALAEEKSRYEQMVKELEDSRESILEGEGKRARQAVQNAELRFQRALRALRSRAPQEAEKEEQKQREQIQEVRQTLLNEFPSQRKLARRLKSGPIEIGVRARIKGSKNIGTVLNKGEDGRKVELIVRGLRVHTTVDRLEYVGPAETKGPESTHRISAEFGPSLQEINLIGLTVEDALEQVDKVIDQAVLSGKSRIELVHGIGTGALRRAIQERLKEHALVKGFNHPDARHGGVGVTTVELKG